MARLPLALALILICSSTVAEQSIRITAASAKNNTMDLVHLIFDATVSDYGKYRFEHVKTPGQARTIEELSNNRLFDLVWMVSNREREALLQPIRIPIDMGMMGYRVCVIRKRDQHHFDKIHSLRDWKKSQMKIGTGTHWADAKVLFSNDLKVITSLHYSPLFNMLQERRFDCLSRSIIEVADEKAQLGKVLAVEQRLLFVYPMPSYFFVSKQNKKLANRIQTGFERIRENGQYKEYIQRSKINKTISLNLSKRRIIRLHNPHLSEATLATLDDPSLWFDIHSFKSPTMTRENFRPAIASNN